MGPRSDNRGYLTSRRPRGSISMLQWVHGRITVVMQWVETMGVVEDALQWVHGRITVVIGTRARRTASTGCVLQWVHGRITVVIALEHAGARVVVVASMGPRSDNRGYDESSIEFAD